MADNNIIMKDAYKTLSTNVTKLNNDTEKLTDDKADKLHTHQPTDINDLAAVIKQSILELVYPVGSIYISVSSTNNPSSIFPNTTWERITDRFLYCTSSSTGGEIGGSKKITVDNLPSHSHLYAVPEDRGGDPLGATNNHWTEDLYRNYWRGNYYGNISKSNSPTSSTGKGRDYLPPYYTVIAWRRTA